MKPEKIKARIQENISTTEVHLIDLTGTADHWQVVVVSDSFEGLPLIKQHRMVLDLFKAEIASNDVHALSVKTFTPERWKQQKGAF